MEESQDIDLTLSVTLTVEAPSEAALETKVERLTELLQESDLPDVLAERLQILLKRWKTVEIGDVEMEVE